MPEQNPAQSERSALFAALQGQQEVITAMAQKLQDWEGAISAIARVAFRTEGGLLALADLAGAGDHVKTAMRMTADENNPAQPEPSKGSEAPKVTTEQARQPMSQDSLDNKGEAPQTNTAPDATENVQSKNTTVLDPTLDLNEVDVQKLDPSVQSPPTGTDAHAPVDVRAETGDNTSTMFPWTLSSARNRVFASLRLARLQIQAGIVEGDDFSLGEKIASDTSITDESIEQQVQTLSSVLNAQANRREASAQSGQAAPRRLVPRPGQQRHATAETPPPLRTAPSMQTAPTGFRATALAEDPEAEMLFDEGPAVAE
jgi:hypothetical protein